MATPHWPIGGSSAYRTKHCPGWATAAMLGVKRIKQSNKRKGKKELPAPPTDSIYAKRGTILHAALDNLLKLHRGFDEEVADAVLDNPGLFPAPAEVYVQRKLEHAYEVLNERFEQAEQCATEMTIPSTWAPKTVGGTLDQAWYRDGVLNVCDYKSGDGEQKFLVTEDGVKTDVFWQLLFYAGMLSDASDPTRNEKLPVNLRQQAALLFPPGCHSVTLHVIHAGREHTSHDTNTLPLEEFKQLWERDLGPTLELAGDMFDTLTPEPDTLHFGDHCSYCPAQGFCPEYHRVMHQTDKLVLTEASHEMIGEALTLMTQLTKLKAGLMAYAANAIENGEEIPGFKMVQGRPGNRKWVDEVKVKEALADDSLNDIDANDLFKLNSPTQIEKLFKENDLPFDVILGNLVTRSEPGTSVVPETDKRAKLIGLEGLRESMQNL